jgi:hypothetical protein
VQSMDSEGWYHRGNIYAIRRGILQIRSWRRCENKTVVTDEHTFTCVGIRCAVRYKSRSKFENRFLDTKQSECLSLCDIKSHELCQKGLCVLTGSYKFGQR